MNIRVRFSKHGCLEIHRTSGCNEIFSEGYAPCGNRYVLFRRLQPAHDHVFASPLGLGLESDGEYMDISVKQSPSSKEAVERLNAVMAEGIEVLSWRELPENSKMPWQVWPGLIMKSVSGKAMNWKKAGKRSWKSFLLCQRSVS